MSANCAFYLHPMPHQISESFVKIFQWRVFERYFGIGLAVGQIVYQPADTKKIKRQIVQCECQVQKFWVVPHGGSGGRHHYWQRYLGVIVR